MKSRGGKDQGPEATTVGRAVLVVAIVLLSVTVLGGVAVADDSPDVEVHPDIYEAEGETTLVLQLPERGKSDAGTAAVDAETLKSHAERTQSPVVSSLAEIDGVTVEERFWITNAIVVSVESVDEGTVRRLAAIDGVERIHPNFEVTIPDPVDPGGDDRAAAERLDEQEAAVRATEENVTYGLDQIDVPETRAEFGVSGDGVNVAVLDTGVDPTHPDIEDSFGTFAEFDENGTRKIDAEPRDTDGHGTHVSGTVVGGAESGTEIGVAPNATLHHGLVLENGTGTFGQITAGIEWAIGQDADVVVMSLGVTEYEAALLDPVQNARGAGTIPVVSVGNAGEGTSSSPGNYPESFSVGATTMTENVAVFSSGETIDTAEAWGDDRDEDWPDEYVVPDVTAPGELVLSAVPDGEYTVLSGTSMAAPHVAGVAALALEADRSSSVADTEAAIVRTTRKPDGDSDMKDPRYGFGIVDARSTLEYATTDTGIEGTVTEDGEPLEGVQVELVDGYAATTDEEGRFELVSTPGEAELRVSEFGYDDTTKSVTVPETGTETVTIDLQSRVDLHVTDDAPGGVRADDGAIETVLEVINGESITVTHNGSYGGTVTLAVDGREASFGEPVGIEDGPVDVTVVPETETRGTIELVYEIDGVGEPRTITTTTLVEDDPVEVGVVGGGNRTVGDNAAAIADDVDGQLPPGYFTEPVDVHRAAEGLDEYDVVLVNHLPDDDDLAETILERTDSPAIGAVYLEMEGPQSNATSRRAELTGDPGSVETGTDPSLDPETKHAVRPIEAHPIFDGIPDDPEGFAVHTSNEDDYGFVEDTTGTAVAETTFGGETKGDAIVVGEFDHTVIAAGFGRSSHFFIDHDEFTDTGNRVLANAVEYTHDRPRGTLVGTVTTADGEPIENASVDLGTAHTVTTDPDGEFETEADHGEWTLRLSAFGYETRHTTATVPESGTAHVEMELQSVPDVAVRDGPPEAVRAGDQPIETTLETVDAQELVVSRAGGYSGEATLTIDGAAAEFDEPVAIEDGTVDLAVNTEAETNGTLRLEYAVSDDQTTTRTETTTAVRESLLGVDLADPPEDRIDAGDSFGLSFDTVDADNVTITRTGDYTGDPTLGVDNAPIDFGETYPIEDEQASVDVDVFTDEGEWGHLSLAFEFHGAERSLVVETTTAVRHENASVYAGDDGVVRIDGLRSAVEDWQQGLVDASLLEAVIESWASGDPVG